MSNDRRQILDMLASGKITAEEAEQLLEALNVQGDNVPVTTGKTAKHIKYLRVEVDPKDGHARHKDKVNIKIPLSLIKAGIKLGAVIPESGKHHIHEKLHQHGLNIDLDKLNDESLGEIIAALSETSIDVDDEHERVRIYTE